MKKALIVYTLSLPSFVFAQENLQEFTKDIGTFIANTIIPFLLGIAFLIFVINAVRFFIIQGTNEQGREKAKALALYSVFAFVLLITFWGIVNLLASSGGYNTKGPVISDYCDGGNCLPAPPKGD